MSASVMGEFSGLIFNIGKYIHKILLMKSEG